MHCKRPIGTLAEILRRKHCRLEVLDLEVAVEARSRDVLLPVLCLLLCFAMFCHSFRFGDQLEAWELWRHLETDQDGMRKAIRANDRSGNLGRWKQTRYSTIEILFLDPSKQAKLFMGRQSSHTDIPNRPKPLCQWDDRWWSWCWWCWCWWRCWWRQGSDQTGVEWTGFQLASNMQHVMSWGEAQVPQEHWDELCKHCARAGVCLSTLLALLKDFAGTGLAVFFCQEWLDADAAKEADDRRTMFL